MKPNRSPRVRKNHSRRVSSPQPQTSGIARHKSYSVLNPSEFKIQSLRECPVDSPYCTTPNEAAAYWRRHVEAHPHFNPDVECFVVALLNSRHRVLGHILTGIGTLDTVTVHPREVFRAAIIGAAAAIIIMHNHPSGDPSPSDADTKITENLILVGRIVKIEVLDHVIIGHRDFARGLGYASLRELGYFTDAVATGTKQEAAA